MIHHMRHGSPPRLLAPQPIDARALRKSHPAPSAGNRIIDETGFLKQGQASCGVARQYTGSAGKITNCQIGVFAAYVSDKGHAFIDRQLYLPRDWTRNPARLRAAHVPEAVEFTTKPGLALRMVERALEADMPF